MSDEDLYTWPNLIEPDDDPREIDEHDMTFASWAYRVQKELQPVYATMYSPMPDDPTLMDSLITQNIEGWAPRVANLGALAEYHYRKAEGRKLRYVKGGNEKISMAEAEVRMRAHLAPYRFVRDHLVAMREVMADRLRWGQSVRKIVTPQ